MSRNNTGDRTMDITENFNPKPWARNPHLQTFFKSLKLLKPGKNAMVDCAQQMIIDAGGGVRLLGYYSKHTDNASKGLLLILHGWEGSSDSVYILRTGKYFFDRGYDIFRLNLRDHGDSHHLNEGLFHGGLIEEAVAATRSIMNLARKKPLYVLGFSLGGNFALRIALKQTEANIENLTHVFGISPVLDPHKATIAIDRVSPFYRKYFLKKWLRSLKKKQDAFPNIYKIDAAFTMKTVMEITDYIIPRYSHFKDHREYFGTYTLRGDVFSTLSVPVTIVTAEDDPVIPINDFYGLHDHDKLHLSIQRYGGHCGFLDPFPFGSWYERKIFGIINNHETSSPD
jgi:predicted alpha/beta-fold hydrolase